MFFRPKMLPDDNAASNWTLRRNVAWHGMVWRGVEASSSRLKIYADFAHNIAAIYSLSSLKSKSEPGLVRMLLSSWQCGNSHK